MARQRAMTQHGATRAPSEDEPAAGAVEGTRTKAQVQSIRAVPRTRHVGGRWVAEYRTRCRAGSRRSATNPHLDSGGPSGICRRPRGPGTRRESGPRLADYPGTVRHGHERLRRRMYRQVRAACARLLSGGRCPGRLRREHSAAGLAAPDPPARGTFGDAAEIRRRNIGGGSTGRRWSTGTARRTRACWLSSSGYELCAAAGTPSSAGRACLTPLCSSVSPGTLRRGDQRVFLRSVPCHGEGPGPPLPSALPRVQVPAMEWR
jgi:hypothetical protein